MILLDTIIQNGDDDALAGVALLPCLLHVHVQTPATILKHTDTLFIARTVSLVY